MIKAIVDESLKFELAPESDGSFTVNGEAMQPEILQHSEQLWKIRLGTQRFTIFVHGMDQATKTVDMTINGKRTQVEVHSRIDQLLKQLGMEAQLSQKLDSLKAPMPGLIHSFKVAEGDSVTKGQPLLILEAMKMENIIKAPGDGIVKEIHAQAQASVEKNELLISFQ